jgi:hypothetical protein
VKGSSESEGFGAIFLKNLGINHAKVVFSSFATFCLFAPRLYLRFGLLTRQTIKLDPSRRRSDGWQIQGLLKRFQTGYHETLSPSNRRSPEISDRFSTMRQPVQISRQPAQPIESSWSSTLSRTVVSAHQKSEATGTFLRQFHSPTQQSILVYCVVASALFKIFFAHSIDKPLFARRELYSIKAL